MFVAERERITGVVARSFATFLWITQIETAPRSYEKLLIATTWSSRDYDRSAIRFPIWSAGLYHYNIIIVPLRTVVLAGYMEDQSGVFNRLHVPFDIGAQRMLIITFRVALHRRPSTALGISVPFKKTGRSSITDTIYTIMVLLCGPPRLMSITVHSFHMYVVVVLFAPWITGTLSRGDATDIP